MKAYTATADLLLDQPTPVLNHGFIQLVDYMGNDEAIVQAARCSVGKTTKTLSDDRSLIRRLMCDKHTSPFEMVSFKFLCKMPIFVARQWVRHRTAKLNEMSGRYSVLPDEFYIPEPVRVAYQNPKNKQGSGNLASENIADAFIECIRETATETFNDYKNFIGKHEEGNDSLNDIFSDSDYSEIAENGGISRELARINLPVGTYTMWMWKIDLHNLFHFLRLRLDPAAQYEIRCYAEAMIPMVKAVCPLAYEAFQDYVLDSMTLSRPEIAYINTILTHEDFTVSNSTNLSQTEFSNLLTKIKKLGIFSDLLTKIKNQDLKNLNASE